MIGFKKCSIAVVAVVMPMKQTAKYHVLVHLHGWTAPGITSHSMCTWEGYSNDYHKYQEDREVREVHHIISLCKTYC